jgi:hypothetical protein
MLSGLSLITVSPLVTAIISVIAVIFIYMDYTYLSSSYLDTIVFLVTGCGNYPYAHFRAQTLLCLFGLLTNLPTPSIFELVAINVIS